MDPGRAQQMLADERSRIEATLRGLSAGEPEEQDTVDPGDSADDVLEAEIEEGLQAQLQEQLEAIERAERRIAEGTYGMSVESGNPIPDGRLEAVPWAERTVDEEEASR
jgi:DnaK suppressor protein